MPRNRYHRIIARWRAICEHSCRPFRVGKWLQVLIEELNVVKGYVPVRRVVVAADDVVGFEDRAKRPIEDLSITGGIGERSTVARCHIQTKNVPGRAAKRPSGTSVSNRTIYLVARRNIHLRTLRDYASNAAIPAGNAPLPASPPQYRLQDSVNTVYGSVYVLESWKEIQGLTIVRTRFWWHGPHRDQCSIGSSRRASIGSDGSPLPSRTSWAEGTVKI
jgi:hypothetical protein